MSSSKSPYDNLPPPRAESHVSSSTMNSKDGAQVSTKRGPDALSVASSPRKKQKAKKEATVLFALSRIKQAMQVEPPYVKLCKATGLLRRLIGEGAASYTAEERLKLLECLGCAFETFSTLDIDYALRSDLGSAFEDLFDSVTKAAEFETAPGMDKCIALAKTVIKMERADESFVFAKLVKFALSSLQTDLKTGALKEEKRSTESYEYNAVAHHLRSVYIAVAAKGIRKRKRYKWAKQPVDQYFKELRKNLDIFTAEQYQRTTSLVDAMLKHDGKPSGANFSQSFDAHPLRPKETK